jgi:hypothetical protein
MQQLRLNRAVAPSRAGLRPAAAMAQRPAAAAAAAARARRRQQQRAGAQPQQQQPQQQQEQQRQAPRLASVLGAAALSLGLMLSSPALPPAHAGPQVRRAPAGRRRRRRRRVPRRPAARRGPPLRASQPARIVRGAGQLATCAWPQHLPLSPPVPPHQALADLVRPDYGFIDSDADGVITL